MVIRPIGSVLLLMIAASLEAAPLGTSFTYQGQLKENGQPANGLFDLQFCLFDAASGPIPLACATDADNVPVEGGLFTVTLDFGATPFNGEARHLELRVRPGASTGGYTILDPRQVIRPTPEALRATAASVAPWSGLSGMPAGFADGVDANSGGTMSSFVLGGGLIDSDGNASIAQGDTLFIPPGGIGRELIASQAIGLGQIDPNEVQPAITGMPCPTGAFMVGVSGSSISCGSSGIVSSVTGGGGVTATPTTGGVVLGTDATVQRRSAMPPGTTCPSGEAMTALAQSGTPTCSQFSRFAQGFSAMASQPTAGGGPIGATTNVTSLGRTLLFTASVEMGSTMPGGAGDLSLSICGNGTRPDGTGLGIILPGTGTLAVAAGQRALFTFTTVLDGSQFLAMTVSICGSSGTGANWNNNGQARLVVVSL